MSIHIATFLLSADVFDRVAQAGFICGYCGGLKHPTENEICGKCNLALLEEAKEEQRLADQAEREFDLYLEDRASQAESFTGYSDWDDVPF